MRELLSLVAMACRFPDAPTIQDFWENLKNGHDALSEIPPTRWDAQHHYDPTPGTVGKCATTKGYFLDDVRHFDPDFFKILPEDAEVMDPQQRILLELCYEAFLSVGYTRARLSGQKIGVFMGITKSDYQNNVAEALARQELTQKTVVTGILENLIAARIAHYFDLTGPALTLDTACSSSLVALHMAKESILAGDCEMALVGGINLNLNAPAFLGMSAAHALSPGEHYHVFDERSNGFFMGEGGGVLLLKKHSQALADNNPILAVLAGSAVNNDGRSVSPMAPRSKTQQAALLQAYQDAGVHPDEITLIEAHGTGTALGDAVEAQTLNAVFTGDGHRPVLSTVKPNIGHLLSAAGMGSLIKVLLCFQHRQIPPLLHYAQARKQLQLEARGFRLNTELLHIPEHETMIAGINGFGFGGTNAHIVLRAAHQQVPTTPYRQIVPDYQKKPYWVGLKTSPVSTSASTLASTPTLASPQVEAYESRWFAQDLPPLAAGVEAVEATEVAEPYLIVAHPLLRHGQRDLLNALQKRRPAIPCLRACDWGEIEVQLGADERPYVWVLFLPLSAQSLYDSLQSLAKSSLLSRCLRLVVVTQGALPLANDPPQATLDLSLQSGLLWGAASELGLPLVQIDLAPAIDFTLQLDALVHVLMQPHVPLQIALRTGKLWQRSQRKIGLVSEPPLPSRLRQTGVYLITGGASGIGALITESFASRQPQAGLTLIAVGRRTASEVSGLTALQGRIAALGSRLDYYRLDISDSAEVLCLCQQILSQHGQLDGVVHAAGQVAPADLRRTDYAARLGLMAPKVKGLRYLREALLESSLIPDFFVAFSSLSAALPGYGRGLIDYVAANHFMDLYATSVAQTTLPLQVIQWGPWQGSGMADHGLLQAQLASWGIQAFLPEEGVSAFHRFIDGGFAQALMLKTAYSLQALAERLPPLKTTRPPVLSPGQSDANPPVTIQPETQSGTQSETQSALERRLQQLLQATLAESGLEVEIGPEDNLMDIGIDSLEAIELTKTLGDWGYQDLPFALFFEYQSIRQLADYLLSHSPTATEPEADHRSALEERLRQLLQATLAESGLEVEIGPEDNLMDIGIDSLEAIELTKTLGDWGYQDLPFALFFEYQSIRQLADYLLSHSASPPGPSPEDAPALVHGSLSYPLSPIQTAFYLAQTLYERPNYSYFRLSLKRLLDPERLAQACLDLLAQHPQLRAAFQSDLQADGLHLTYQIVPVEQIRARLAAQELITLLPLESALTEDSFAVEDRFVNQRFDLEQAPLFRIGLQQRESGSQLLLLFHHIIFDGISMRNFVQGLWERYHTLESQQQLSYPPLTLSYADYVQSVQQYRDSEGFQTARLALADYLDCKPFAPEAFLRGLAERHATLGDVPADSYPRVIAPTCSQALIQRAQQTQTPLQMLYLSAFFKALSQWSGQKQLWVQVANAGRQWPLADIHRLIGSFADLFPVYADLNQGEGLCLAQTLRQQWNQSQPLQRVGSDQVVRFAQERGISLPFSFSFAHFDTAWMSPEDQAQVESTQMRGHHAQTQLGLLISENNHGFYYSFNSPHGLFLDSEINDLCMGFEQALMEISRGAAEITRDAAETPDLWSGFHTAPDVAPALYTSAGHFNYRELRFLSLGLVRHLQAAGLENGAVLVFWGDAAPGSIALLLACLTLGVTWVPVDSQSPAQRVDVICGQCHADLLVTSLSSDITTALKQPWCDLSAWVELTEPPQEEPSLTYTVAVREPDAIAYIIFTSGSTGQPKGVPILYTALMRYLAWAIACFDYRPADRVLLASSLAFDASLRPILATLMTGGCLCLLTEPVKRDPQLLLRWIREARITLWSSVPSLWQGLIQALESEREGDVEGANDLLPDLRLTQLGGEVLSPQWLQRWQDLMGTERPVVNLYGPTETTLNATYHWLNSPHVQGQAVPMGHALPYLKCRVMSPQGQPCAVEESGELWVSGPTLTPGYLATSSQTKTREAFALFEGLRYYRTGDRVSQDSDGLFYYLGRLDRQIKLRGYRLEPAEIERALLDFPDVLEARVDSVQRTSGAQQLVAWVGSSIPLDPEALQRHLTAILPDYMLPEIHYLTTFPRLPNGKSDVAALRQTLMGGESAASTPSHAFYPAIAARVTAVWQAVLKLETFHETADFFQLGGDSLLLMQAYLMLQQDHLHLPKIARFHSQRRWQDWVTLVAEGATEAVTDVATDPLKETVVSTSDTDKRFALSPSQMGFYLWHQHLHQDHSLWEARLHLEGDLDAKLFERALWVAARRHQMLNVNLEETRPPAFTPSQAPRFDFSYGDLSQKEAGIDAAITQYFAESRHVPLDIFQDSLLRCHLLKLGPQRYLWVVQAHHILADGLSCLILGRDIFTAYRQLQHDTFTASEVSEVSVGVPLRSQFSDYIALLAQERSQAGAAHQRYWQKIFALPYAAPHLRKTASQASGFFTIERSLTQRDLAAFKQSCQRASSTLFMGVLVAYQQALIQLTGQSDLIIGVAHHGRDYPLPDIDQIFGCFARTLPLRLPPLSRGEAMPDAIQSAQRCYQEAAAHPLDPVGVMRALAEPPLLQTLLGSQFFMSYVDMNPLMEMPALPDMAINWQASGSHFQPSNEDTDFFLALKQQGDQWIFTLNVHQAACTPSDAQAFLAQLLQMLTLVHEPAPLPARSFVSAVAEVQSLAFDVARTGPLDAALISYLPALDHIERAAPSLSRPQIESLKTRLFPEGKALWLERLQTPLGQSANLVLPFFANEIQPGQAKRILPAIQQARAQAFALGARVVSLAGLLPALSAYGRDLAGSSSQRLTTGHSTTVVAMLYTLRFALQSLNRSLAHCRLVMVGLGSIGEATLDLLLATQPHPASLTLVDRLGSDKRLQQLAEKLSARHAFKGAVKVILSAQAVPAEVYGADLILSAVSARQVIDIAQLRPGTVVIDDSFPHCFDVSAAIERMQQQRDLLVIGGGLLQVPDTHKQIYLPLPHPDLQRALTEISLPGCLPGCQLESLLLAAYPELPETLGLVDPDKLLRYLPVIEAAGIRAAPLHLESYCVPEDLIERMARELA